MSDKKVVVRWDELRGIAEELASERLDVLADLGRQARELASGNLSAQDMRSRAADMEKTAADRLGELRDRMAALAQKGKLDIEAAAEDPFDAIGLGNHGVARGLERRARRHDSAMRERMEAAPDGVVRVVQAYPWAAVNATLVVALVAGILVGALLSTAKRRVHGDA